MPYIGTSPSNSVRRVHTYTATASQTTFTGASSEGVTLSYVDTNYIDVFQNGVLLGSADYTSTSGTSVVLAQGASADDLIVIVVYDVFSVADTVSKTNGGSFDNGITIDADGATVLTVDRATSDGTIIDVQKSGSTVGSIGYESSGFHINGEANHSGLSFQAPNVTPRYNGSLTDDFVHLGSTSNRFKNLYLSGGVYLGGTGSANKLDDYEEGTWNPSLGGNTTYTEQEGFYRKVGSLVFVWGLINVNVKGTGSTQVISGLPFSSTREFTIPISKLINSTFNFYSAQLRTSESTLYLSAQTALDGSIENNQNYFQNSTLIQFSGSYITS